MKLSDYKSIGIFTSQLAYPCKGDPFNEVSEIIEKDGLASGEEIRISAYTKRNGLIHEEKILIRVLTE